MIFLFLILNTEIYAPPLLLPFSPRRLRYTFSFSLVSRWMFVWCQTQSAAGFSGILSQECDSRLIDHIWSAARTAKKKEVKNRLKGKFIYFSPTRLCFLIGYRHLYPRVCLLKFALVCFLPSYTDSQVLFSVIKINKCISE